jgi:DNA-binding IclR family transcriptional regulator
VAVAELVPEATGIERCAGGRFQKPAAKLAGWRHKERGHVRVGPELVRLSVLIAEGLDVRRIARPTLEATAAAIDEAAILALNSPIRHQFQGIDAAESTHPIKCLIGIGALLRRAR